MKNSKAISPIFATLILIAIAVIAGVVVYMFTSGTLATMTAGGTAGTEKVAIQGVNLNATASPSSVIVYAQSTNTMAVTINSIIIKNTNGDIVCSVAPTSGATLLSTGALSPVTATGLTGVTTGTPYSITLVSTKGGSFVSSQIIAG